MSSPQVSYADCLEFKRNKKRKSLQIYQNTQYNSIDFEVEQFIKNNKC